jgi:putative secretion ATPase (PEP-CTERM system associated)
MYLEFFGLQEKPFGLTPDPKFLFLSGQHREALDHLLYGIKQKEGFVVISGDIGTGKTTLCRALLERLDAETVTTALIFNPLLAEEELLRAILEDFKLPAKGTTRKDLLDELNHFLLKELTAGKTVVLIIDEAQNLTTSCLELVRLLSNLETHKEKLIQIILVGSEELQAKLEKPELRQLEQRVSIQYHLGPLGQNETRTYIQHRLAMAGAMGAIPFEKRAYRGIFRFSGGVPRLINMIADRSLLSAYLLESRKITHVQVEHGLASLRGEVPGGKQRYGFVFHRRFHPAIFAVFAMAVVATLLLGLGDLELLERYYLQRLRSTFAAPRQNQQVFTRTAIPQPKPEVRMVKAQTTLKTVEPLDPEGTDEEKSPQAVITTTKASETEPFGFEEEKASSGDERDEKFAPPVLGAATVSEQQTNEVMPQYVFKPPYIYTVQVNSFKLKTEALDRLGELHSRDFNAWVAWVDLGERGIWYRVLLGKYEEKDQALALRRQLIQNREFEDARQVALNAEIVGESTRTLP